MADPLPIDDILPDVTRVLARDRRLVIQAPPGAGKTTRVPLSILEAGLTDGRILMLEPRRLAARAAAERMAQTLGEKVGETVGYRVRGTSAVSAKTRIEVITEGILTRMLQDRPDLPGTGVVIFDEFHERSLNADLGLALCLESAGALRDDLMLVAMSATLDAAPVAKMMEAEILTSEGRAFDVETKFLDKPAPRDRKQEHLVSDLVLAALSDAQGSALVFLPGEGEIRRVGALLAPQLPVDTTLHPLFGALPFAQQRAAIVPPETGRKVVLATSIAETSLTIEGIRIVVDAGLARRAVFDPSSGMSRLVTTRVTRAEATQRTGRAGRVAPGVCYRMWTRGEDGALAAFPPAEIEAGDLTGFALELAVWGGREDDMAFVTPPHAGRMEEARRVLRMLDALDSDGRITEHGRTLARLPLHPRLAHMVVRGGQDAPLLAALLSGRDILRGAPVDLTRRLRAVKDPRGYAREFGQAPDRSVVARIREDARRYSGQGRSGGPEAVPELAALAYPDRIGLRREGDAPRYVLSGGKGAVMPAGDPLAGARLIVATDLDGDPREARVRQATELSFESLRSLFGALIEWKNICEWSRREGRVLTRRREMFGALVLDDRTWPDAPPDDVACAMAEGVRQTGLSPDGAAARFIARARLAHQSDPEFPDFSTGHLTDTLETWLAPHLAGVTSLAAWKRFDLLPALRARLSWEQTQTLDRLAPAHFVTPLGRKVPIDYDGSRPKIAVRLQELFGVTRHPEVAGTPLQITLLSPAQRPVQVTEDLPGFWASSYADVRKDMRGRYPKHPWPEDPTAADPTLRARPRKP